MYYCMHIKDKIIGLRFIDKLLLKVNQSLRLLISFSYRRTLSYTFLLITLISSNAIGGPRSNDYPAEKVTCMRLNLNKEVSDGKNIKYEFLHALYNLSLQGKNNAVPISLSDQSTSKNFKFSKKKSTIKRYIETRAGVINSSLLAAAAAADIPSSVALQIVSIFKDRINFSSDLRSGDCFSVAYETFWKDGQFLRVGRVLVTDLVNKGRNFQAAWFKDYNSSQSGYYNFDGQALERSFLRLPLVFTRISSRFAMRMHPILGKWKNHAGVDFAAPSGTPIHATSDGTIKFSGIENGYGKVVIINHGHRYSTLYAHMSRFASRSYKGNKVKQGDIIGYVGMTGWATGPHLHYEFRDYNRPRDPLSKVTHVRKSLTGSKLQYFKAEIAGIICRLNVLKHVINND